MIFNRNDQHVRGQSERYAVVLDVTHRIRIDDSGKHRKLKSREVRSQDMTAIETITCVRSDISHDERITVSRSNRYLYSVQPGTSNE